MRDFHAEDWFTITGRGDVAAIATLPEGDDLYDPDLLKGQRVLIDGTEHLVLGVETFCIPRYPEKPYRHPFGLLVEPVAEEPQP